MGNHMTLEQSSNTSKTKTKFCAFTKSKKTCLLMSLLVIVALVLGIYLGAKGESFVKTSKLASWLGFGTQASMETKQNSGSASAKTIGTAESPSEGSAALSPPAALNEKIFL